MIEVKVDLSRASRREVEAFLALPGVARALDAMTHAPLFDDDVNLEIAIAPPPARESHDGEEGGRT
ncbi:MAG: hypothetical protein NVS9B10_26330 [Nevskia sp.]